MFDRWRKLGKAFYSEKRGQFDISKVMGTPQSLQQRKDRRTPVPFECVGQLFSQIPGLVSLQGRDMSVWISSCECRHGPTVAAVCFSLFVFHFCCESIHSATRVGAKLFHSNTHHLLFLKPAKQYEMAPGVLVQVPDIYDSAKYDAIHNRHLGLDVEPVYQVHAERLM